MRYRFLIEYLGTPFAGWQFQEGVSTVQGELEKALAIVLREPVRIIGAGRTDAGVHAAGQVAHFDFHGEFEPRRLSHSLNALTRPDICVRNLESCSPDFHARYNAISRRYQYRIALRPVALLRDQSWAPGFPLDKEIFQSELSSALGRRDFTNFSLPRNDGKSTQCDLLRAEVVQLGDFLLVTVEADRFLHKMVRSLVGAAYDAARGVHPPGLITSIFENRFQGERTWAPAHGLCLEKVTYPDGYG